MIDDPLGLGGHVLDGKYQVDAFVAEGGFAFVYRARHVHLRKPVALKVLKVAELATDQARAEVAAQFRAEAEIVARLTHPAIVPVLDYGVSAMPDGLVAPWMALEWVSGEALADDLDARRGAAPRTAAEVLTLLRPVLLALSKTHAAGVAHRDIKPRNLMLTAGGDPDEPPLKILDFGIAKAMAADERRPPSGDTVTRSVAVSFTVGYAAPEQVIAMRTGPWTDVYQLALVVTELLTHRRPYVEADPLTVRHAVLNGPPPTPGRFGVDVGRWEPVLQRALSKRPADRHKTARELLDDLEANLAATPRVSVPMGGPVAAGAGFDATARGGDMLDATARAPVAPPLPVAHSAAPASAPRPRSPWWLAAAVVVALVAVAALVAVIRRSAG